MNERSRTAESDVEIGDYLRHGPRFDGLELDRVADLPREVDPDAERAARPPR